MFSVNSFWMSSFYLPDRFLRFMLLVGLEARAVPLCIEKLPPSDTFVTEWNALKITADVIIKTELPGDMTGAFLQFRIPHLYLILKGKWTLYRHPHTQSLWGLGCSE